MEELLTQVELNTYVTNYLQASDWRVQFEESKWELLKLLTRRYGTHPKFSFQNVTMASLDPTLRRAPTKFDAKLKCSNGLGGMCIEHNYFFASILVSIGYDAYVVGADVSLVREVPLCHPVCVIKQGDDLFMVDFGMGAPFPYEPIPLRKGKPYTYTVGGFNVEYRLTDEGICQRVHILGDPLKGVYRNENEEIRTFTDLKPRTFEEFEEPMTIIFTDPKSFFLNTLYAFRYIQATEDDFLAIIILGTKVMEMTKYTLTEKEFEKYEDIYPTFKANFPDLSMDELVRAVRTFRANNSDGK